VTDRELPNTPKQLLSAVDKQRLFLLRVEGTAVPCPARNKPGNAFEAPGVTVDGHDFGRTCPAYSCPRCGAAPEQVAPLFSIGPLVAWRLPDDWLRQQLAKARSFDRPNRAERGADPGGALLRRDGRRTPHPFLRGTDRMSHIVTIQTRVHDAGAAAAACRRLGLEQPMQGTAQLYSGEATGLLVRLPGWQYPVVLDLLTGAVRYDNYGGAWGVQAHLGSFLQAYALERAKQEARKRGYQVSEQQLEGGAVKLTITEGA
jgi:hypothetical protein